MPARTPLASPARNPPDVVPKRLLNAGAFMMTGGRFCRPHDTSMQTGRMSQTSIERLRDYLAQLPPQSQALLMREFERAIERGEDTTVATFVLEQLRKVVRSTDEEARPRIDDPARLLFRPLAISRRRQYSGAAWAGPPRIAVAGLAVAEPRRGARSGARVRGGAGPDAGSRNQVRTRSGGA